MLEDSSFRPEHVEVVVGDTVTWSHRDGTTPHSVTSTGGPRSFDSHAACTPPGTTITCMSEGDADYTRTFDEPGTYPIRCKIHSSMVGSVVVRQAPAPTTSSSATTSPAPPDTTTTVPPPPVTATSPTNPPAPAPTAGPPPPAGEGAVEPTGEEAVAPDGGGGSGGAAAVATLLLFTVGAGATLLWKLRPGSGEPLEAILVDDESDVP